MVKLNQSSASESKDKKRELLNLLSELIEQVEAGKEYGEFGLKFSAQNGIIGHYETNTRRTYK